MNHVWSLIVALSVKALFFTFSSGTGLGATFDCTGFGFQPKAVLLFWNGRSEATDTVGLLDSHAGIGCAISTTMRFASNTFYDQGTTNCIVGSRYTNAGCMLTNDATGAETGRVDFDSFLADGVRFVIDDVLVADIKVMVVAFGGTDLTNVFAGTYLTGTATGNVDFTGVGFDPGDDSLCIFFNNALDHGAAPPSNPEDIAAPMFGAARTKTGSIQQFVTTINSDDDSATMDTDSHSIDGICLASMDQVGDVGLGVRASFVQSITDGFRLNIAELAGAFDRQFFVLILKGGQYHLGDLTTQLDTTTDMVESGFGFQPKGALFISHCLAKSTSDTTQAGAQLSIGFCTSTTDEIALGFHDENGTGNMETEAAIRYSDVYVNLDAAAGVEGAMRAQSFPDSDGFTMRMSDADPSATFVWYIAFGDAAAGAAGQPTMARWGGVAHMTPGPAQDWKRW